MQITHDNDPWGISEKNWSEIRALGRNTTEGSCLNKVLDRALKACVPAKQWRNTFGAKVFLDDCVAHWMLGLSQYQIEDSGFQSNTFQSPEYTFTNSYGTFTSTSPIGFVYFDANCRNVPPVPHEIANECIEASLDYASSPVSLVLNGDYTSVSSTIVKFPLDKKCLDCFYEWKASKSLPLLVLDPQRKGVIDSAEQLFGHWTFGGKVSEMAKADAERNPWQNGYEALAMLDTDGNGVIEGTELSDVRLWFDTNQNGFSESGEVGDLADYGIDRLYYQGAKVLSGTRDLWLQVGFRQLHEGKKRIGASVDWFGSASSSITDLISRREIVSSMRPSAGTQSGLNEEKTEAAIPCLDCPKIDFKKVEGAWEWYSVIDVFGTERQLGGMLVFALHGDRLEGTTINESAFVASQPLAGVAPEKIVAVRKLFADYDPQGFRFNVVDDDSAITSVVRYDEGSDQLLGTTTVSREEAGGIVNLRYNWVAIRREWVS